MWQVSQQLADLFCEWYDELDAAVFHAEIEAWTLDPRLDALSAAIERDAERSPSVASPRMRLENGGGDRQARLFAALRGLDRVFAQIVPALGGIASGVWADPAAEAAVRVRLDTGAHGGMLLPRLVTRNRPGNLPEEPREAFRAVLRVSEDACGCVEHRVVPVASRPHRRDLARGLTIGCAPLVSDPNDLRYDVRESGAGRFYRIAPGATERIAARVEHVLDRFVAANVQLAVMPELVLSPELLEIWTQSLRDRDVGALRLVLAGSGDVAGGDRPVNEAVLLDARSGRELGRHRKLFPFNMTREQLTRLGLADRLGGEPIDEDIARGERATLFDLGGMRIAVLICEDLNRVEDLARHLREFGISHLLIPVFDRELKDRRWVRTRADVYVASTGATVVVSNSLVVPTLTAATGAATSLVTGPAVQEALMLRAADATDVTTAVLHADGSIGEVKEPRA